jgi:hypothetical protein
VDECAGLDALVTNRVWKRSATRPETTLHDVRYGESYPVNGADEFVWVFEISGAVPPAHFIGGYAGAVSERQPPMYFRLGGGSIKGVSKPGEIVWSRVFVEGGALKADIGRAKVVELPREETERRWRITTPQWPIMHAVTYGITRDQMMAKHKSNHVQVAYAPDAGTAANLALATKAAMFREMGVRFIFHEHLGGVFPHAIGQAQHADDSALHHRGFERLRLGIGKDDAGKYFSQRGRFDRGAGRQFKAKLHVRRRILRGKRVHRLREIHGGVVGLRT